MPIKRTNIFLKNKHILTECLKSTYQKANTFIVLFYPSLKFSFSFHSTFHAKAFHLIQNDTYASNHRSHKT